MITLLKAEQRERERRRKREIWMTSKPPDAQGALTEAFGSVAALREGRLPPRGGVRKSGENTEIITYVREGTLGFEDSLGRSGVIHAGEFQRMTTDDGVRYGETNISPTHWAHVFQIWLRSSLAGTEPGHEQKRFSAAERHGRLCAVASPDARGGSLLIHQDTVIYSAILERGQHVIHDLSTGRAAWLHIVHGRGTLDHRDVTTGDGAIVAGCPVSLTAREQTELLLIDHGEGLPLPLQSTADT